MLKNLYTNGVVRKRRHKKKSLNYIIQRDIKWHFILRFACTKLPQRPTWHPFTSKVQTPTSPPFPNQSTYKFFTLKPIYFQDHFTRNSQAKSDRFTNLLSFHVPHVIHIQSSLHNSNDKVLPFHNFNWYQPKYEAI